MDKGRKFGEEWFTDLGLTEEDFGVTAFFYDYSSGMGNPVPAMSSEEIEKYGCPFCGSHKLETQLPIPGDQSQEWGNTLLRLCYACDLALFFELKDGARHSNIGLVIEGGVSVPILFPHPFKNRKQKAVCP